MTSLWLSTTPPCTRIFDLIDTRLNEPIKRLGLLELYNGTNIEQTRDYIRLHSTSYIDKILAANTWIGESARARVDRPVRMNGTSDALQHLDTSPVPSSDSERESLERSMGFSYRKAIGILIWAMVTCRPDLSFAVIKLSQFSNNPGRIHYNHVRHVFRYLQHTRDYGLTYWRTTPCPHLPDTPAPPPVSPNLEDGLRPTDPSDIPLTSLFGYVDSDWASDIRHRRSVSSIAFLLAGAVVAYKTRVQPTVSTSSTEAEFIGASDAAKMALYIRSILNELHVPQTHATLIYEDNAAALMMANASQPTKRTRHMDIRHFAIQEWVECDLIQLKRVDTTVNLSDTLTKPLQRILFYRHLDALMGSHGPPSPILCRST
jgi:hypothetical protein